MKSRGYRTCNGIPPSSTLCSTGFEDLRRDLHLCFNFWSQDIWTSKGISTNHPKEFAVWENWHYTYRGGKVIRVSKVSVHSEGVYPYHHINDNWRYVTTKFVVLPSVEKTTWCLTLIFRTFPSSRYPNYNSSCSYAVWKKRPKDIADLIQKNQCKKPFFSLQQLTIKEARIKCE